MESRMSQVWRRANESTRKRRRIKCRISTPRLFLFRFSRGPVFRRRSSHVDYLRYTSQTHFSLFPYHPLPVSSLSLLNSIPFYLFVVDCVFIPGSELLRTPSPSLHIVPRLSPATMADEARTPLLSEDDSTSSRRRSSSTDKHASTESTQLPPPFELSNESTPLLHRRDDDLAAYGGTQHPRRRSSVSQVSSIGESFTKQRGRVRWPLFCVALALLAVLAILLFAFVAPAMVEEYVKEAAIFRPTNVSIESATSNGIRTRVQGDFTLDAKRVHKRSAQALGRFATWIGREVETGDSETRVYLPEYGNVLVGSASLPSMKLDIRNSHVNHLDFTADVIAGDIPGIRAVAMDWLEGRLGHLRIKGAATLHLKSGILSLGEQTLSDSVTLEGKLRLFLTSMFKLTDGPSE